MAFYEFYDKDGPTGMVVGGNIQDLEFRRAADAAQRPDERLLTIENPADPALERMAVIGYLSSHIGQKALQVAVDQGFRQAG